MYEIALNVYYDFCQVLKCLFYVEFTGMPKSIVNKILNCFLFIYLFIYFFLIRPSLQLCSSSYNFILANHLKFEI